MLVAVQVEQVETSLESMPAVSATASCVVEGETSVEVYEGDVVTCRAHVTLTRPSHRTPGAAAHHTSGCPGQCTEQLALQTLVATSFAVVPAGS